MRLGPWARERQFLAAAAAAQERPIAEFPEIACGPPRSRFALSAKGACTGLSTVREPREASCSGSHCAGPRSSDGRAFGSLSGPQPGTSSCITSRRILVLVIHARDDRRWVRKGAVWRCVQSPSSVRKRVRKRRGTRSRVRTEPSGSAGHRKGQSESETGSEQRGWGVRRQGGKKVYVSAS